MKSRSKSAQIETPENEPEVQAEKVASTQTHKSNNPVRQPKELKTPSKNPGMKPDLQIILEATLKGFPELRSKDITIQWVKLDDALLEVQPMDPDGWIIEVDKSMAKASQKSIIGGIAHELSHIVSELNWKKSTKLFDKILYSLSNRYKTLDERNTDLETILRGFGAELLEFLETTKAWDLDHYEEDGLHLREVQKLLKP